MKNQALFILLIFQLNAIAQPSKNWSLGAGLDANFSTFFHHGLTPYLSFGNDCHSFQIGPRISFASFIGEPARNPQKFVLDADYQMNIYTQSKWLRFLAFFKTEYGFYRSSEEWHYVKPDEIYWWDEIQPESSAANEFDIEKIDKASSFRFYAGTGIGADLTKNLSIQAKAGIGFGFTYHDIQYRDLDYGSYITPRVRFNSTRSVQSILSLGISYRLG